MCVEMVLYTCVNIVLCYCAVECLSQGDDDLYAVLVYVSPNIIWLTKSGWMRRVGGFKVELSAYDRDGGGPL